MKEVSAGIFVKNGRILLAQRGEKGPLPGYWEFPGGKRECDETIFACLEREIMEELGVTCRAEKIFCENVFEYDHGTIKLVAIFSSLTDDDIVLNVHDDYKWIEIADVLSYKLAPADVYIAQRLAAEYGGQWGRATQ
jgi:8-oxo-dGTP diphosphatase